MKKTEAVQEGGRIIVREHPDETTRKAKRNAATAPQGTTSDKLDYIITLLEQLLNH